jgi:hypothetical protein
LARHARLPGPQHPGLFCQAYAVSRPYLIITRVYRFHRAQVLADVEVLWKALENKAVTANPQQLWDVITLYREDLAGWYVPGPGIEEWMFMSGSNRAGWWCAVDFSDGRCLNEQRSHRPAGGQRLLQLVYG